jgi:hypothetical protein
MICTRDHASTLLLVRLDELARDSLRSDWDPDNTDSDANSSPDNSEGEWNLEINASDEEDPNDDNENSQDELVEDPVARFGCGVCEKSFPLL